MDGEVQQQYLAAEQAYGEGDFETAEAIASGLLSRLDAVASNGAEQEACLAWRAFVALLLGHIYFHGLHQPETAETHYQLVLASQPPDTLRDLAQQGVERCKERQPTTTPVPQADPASDANTALATPAPTHTTELTNPEAKRASDSSAMPSHDKPIALELIRDPFLTNHLHSPAAAISAAMGSATPWLTGNPITPIEQASTPPDSTAAHHHALSAVSSEEINAPTTTPDDSHERDGQEVDWQEVYESQHRNHKLSITGADHEEREIALAERAQPPAEPLELSPWLLRRALHFNKR